MASCSAQSLIETAMANGYDALSDRDLKEATVAAACAGGGGGGTSALGPFTGSGSPEGVVTAPPGSIYTDITGGVVIAQYTKQTGVGSTGWV